MLIAVVALILAFRNSIDARVLIFACGVGFAIAVGWVLTFGLSQISFDPVQIESASFTGQSANTLMFFLAGKSVLNFDIGLIPGVFLGAFFAALVAGELRFQGFTDADNMKRALIGAALMGFGGMLAGGCAIGAGVTGGSIFVGTAWAALSAMWVGAVLTDFVVDSAPRRIAA